MSFFASVDMAPGDPILGLTETYLADPRPGKINLGVGIYVDEDGRIPLLRTVQRSGAVAGHVVQAARLPADRWPAGATTSSPSSCCSAPTRRCWRPAAWSRRRPSAAAPRCAWRPTCSSRCAVPMRRSRSATRAGATITWCSAPPASSCSSTATTTRPATAWISPACWRIWRELEPGTVVLLHACCHNPTGVDLDAAQWQQVIALLQERKLLPFVDIAYQGFDQGIDADATAIRLLAASGIEAFVVANSYSKSFSLYGERVGALSMVAADRDEAARVLSQHQADHSHQLLQPRRAWRRAGRRRARQQRAARALGSGAGRDALAHPRHARRAGGEAGGCTARRTSASSRARPACSRIPA